MTALSFISSLVRSIVWPLVVVGLGLLFRSQLASVITALGKRMEHLQTVKAGPAELSFESENELAAAKVESEKLLAGVKERADRTEWLVQELPPGTPGLFRRDAAVPPGSADSRADVKGSLDAAGIDTDGSSSRARLTAMNIRAAAGKTAPGVTVINAWSCLETLVRELAGLLGVADDLGSFTLLADQVITHLDRLGGLPAPDHTRQVISRLLRLKFEVQRGVEASRLAATDYAETVLNTVDLLVAAYVMTLGRRGTEPDPAAAGER